MFERRCERHRRLFCGISVFSSLVPLLDEVCHSSSFAFYPSFRTFSHWLSVFSLLIALSLLSHAFLLAAPPSMQKFKARKNGVATEVAPQWAGAPVDSQGRLAAKLCHDSISVVRNVLGEECCLAMAPHSCLWRRCMASFIAVL